MKDATAKSKGCRGIFETQPHAGEAEETLAPLRGMHVCFRAPNRVSVRTFHGAALSAGGHDNGGPGVRPQYHPDYYAAFVVDPDGHRIEAVCYAPEQAMIV